MGLLDRIKGALAFELPDPNPVITGSPARGRIVDVGPYGVGGEGNTSVRWSKKQVSLVVVGAAEERLTTVSCFLGERAHLWASRGREVPILLDAAGDVLGVDVPAWEAEVEELERSGAPFGERAPGFDPDARAWQQAEGALDAVDGVGFETWVAVEAALATEAVAPGAWDARASQFGVPSGRWATVQAGWQSRMRSDPKLAARFGAAYGAAVER
jgi:hypothetical protein